MPTGNRGDNETDVSDSFQLLFVADKPEFLLCQGKESQNLSFLNNCSFLLGGESGGRVREYVYVGNTFDIVSVSIYIQN